MVGEAIDTRVVANVLSIFFFSMFIETVMFTNESNATEGIADEERNPLATPHSKMLGGTEESWCKAIGCGTRIKILAMLFSESVNPSEL